MTDALERIRDDVLELIGDRAEAQVAVVRQRSGLTRFANSMIHQHVGEDTVTVSVKLAVDGRVAASQTTRVVAEALRDLIDHTLDIARVRPVDPDWPGVAPPEAVPSVDNHDAATFMAEPLDRTAHVRAFVDAAPELRAAGYVDTEGSAIAFGNTAGQRAVGRATRATVDGIHQTDTSAGKSHQTSARLADLDGSAAGAQAARLATDGADPQDVEPGRYEVVLAPECVATIALFLAAYGFNAKAVLEGQSFVKLDEGQFDARFSFWDDATDPRALLFPFDWEGTPKRRVDMVEAGVSRNLVHDRRTARRAGAASTGHAVPGGDSWGAFPTAMFVGTGDAEFDDLVREVDRGLLVTEFNYCRILDPKTQVVTGLTRNGTFLVEGGKIVQPVKNLRFTQSFVEALAPGNVHAVGSEARFADAEFGPGLAYTPAMRLAEWNFTGGARG